MGELPFIEAVQLAALAPAVTFAFLFKYLLVVLQRRIDRVVREQDQKPKARDPGGVLEVV
jgi:hypothetical protein